MPRRWFVIESLFVLAASTASTAAAQADTSWQRYPAISPDVRVMNEYAVVSKGTDQQLDAAIAALLRAVRR